MIAQPIIIIEKNVKRGLSQLFADYQSNLRYLR